MQRRDLLHGVGAVGLASFAGCLEGIPTVGETTLGWFGVYNRHQESHTFDVRIQRDGTTVHRSSHQLAAYNPNSEAPSPPHAVVDCTWENISGDYTASVRRDGGEWHRYDIAENALRPPECVIVYAEYGEYQDTEPNRPTLRFILDETNCAEVRTLSSGCSDAVPNDSA